MRIRLSSIVALAFSVIAATSASAQDASANALSEQQQLEFDQWVKAETAWQQWVQQHGNVADRNWMGMTGRNWRGLPQDRRERPQAPSWLGPYCGSLPDTERDASEACQTYKQLSAFDWVTETLKRQVAGKKPEKPEHSIFNFKRHWGFGLGYDNKMVHGSAGMQMTIAEWGRWNYGTLGASAGFVRRPTVDEKTQKERTRNELSLFITLASASYRIKYVKSLGMYWYADFAQIYDMTHSVVGSQFGFSLSRK